MPSCLRNLLILGLATAAAVLVSAANGPTADPTPSLAIEGNDAGDTEGAVLDTDRAESATPAAPRYLGRLAETELLATGVHELTAREKANLDNLIAYEVASARAGNVNGFAGSFSSRRSAAELDATGLDRMSDDQRTRLDEHIAGFLAESPIIPYRPYSARSRTATTTPSEDNVQGRGPLLDVHGSLSVTVGTGSEGSFYGGSMTTIISDPKGRFNAAVTIGTMRGAVPYYYDDSDYWRSPYRRSTRLP